MIPEDIDRRLQNLEKAVLNGTSFVRRELWEEAHRHVVEDVADIRGAIRDEREERRRYEEREQARREKESDERDRDRRTLRNLVFGAALAAAFSIVVSVVLAAIR